jgi:hypothetical protein
MPAFEIKSDLAIEASEFWSECSLESVNWELAPVVKMTAPADWKNRRIEDWEVGRELFKSWILVFGILPIDRHAFRLREIAPGCGFHERSSSWMNREWNHDRMIVPHDRGCTVIDRVEFISRLPILAPLQLPICRFIFQHRHRRLRKKYGRPAPEPRG